MLYLHSINIIHRDIKPENLLFGEGDKLKLCDFGWSTYELNGEEFRYSYCGTPEYTPPEMINKKGHNHTLDVWSLGILFYEMLAGESPFKGGYSLDIYNKILKN